jgi:cation diffusion facilitator family transporter
VTNSGERSSILSRSPLEALAVPSYKKDIARLAAASIVIAAAVTGIKYFAYLRTGSVALYSDAIESIVNVVTAIAALIAVRVAARPADRRHPFGHHKAEYFSAGLEGALIVIAAVMILVEAHDAWNSPRTLTAPGEGLAINGAATAMNSLWSWFLIRRGRAWRSPAIVADGWHLVTDVVTSAGVLLGLLLALATGWQRLDPLLAAVVAIYILYSGWRIMRHSLSGLMDESVAAEVLEKIRNVIGSSAWGALQVHDLRTRTAGRATFIEFHLVVPGAMTVAAAHDICDRIENALTAAIDGSEVLIHVEPEGEAKTKGALVF